MEKSITAQVAENIGKALFEKDIQVALATRLIDTRLGDFFRPMVRQALAESLGLEPDDIGPELVEEGLQDSITAPYLAKQWLDQKKIPEMVSHLREKHGNRYWLHNDEPTGQVAINLLVTRDEEMVLANAVRDHMVVLVGDTIGTNEDIAKSRGL